MARQKTYEIDMVHGPIIKKMLAFSIPLVFSGILQLLFNAADIIVVGRYAGNNSLAAVGSNTALINLLTNLFIGLSVGANVLAARYYGAKNHSALSNTVHTSMFIALASGILLTFIGVIGAKRILIWMQTPEEVLGLATLYLRIYFIGMTATMLYNFGSALLRAVGDTKRPLYYLLIAGVINVALNLLFVIVFEWDVAGVGIATVISQIISAFLVIMCLRHEESAIRLIFKKICFNKRTFTEMIQIGLPAGFQGVLFALSNVMIQSSINSFGDIVMAGNTASANIEGFVYVSMNAFYQATISFTSQSLGAGEIKRIKKILLTAQCMVFLVGILLGGLVLLFGRELLSIYTESANVIEQGLKRLEIIATTYALCGMMDVMVGALRGIGYSFTPMIVSLVGVCGLRLVWLATIFQVEAYHTTTWLYLSYPLSWIVTFLAHVVCFIIAFGRVKKKIEGYHLPES